VIVVSYLYDLFNHHTLSQRRRAQYRSTLQDLQHFADQRKKVSVLARVAHVHVHFTVGCRNFSRSCGAQPVQPATLPLFATHDPFWPLGDAPDPLQKVDPWR
jgi:hypothetical protein